MSSRGSVALDTFVGPPLRGVERLVVFGVVVQRRDSVDYDFLPACSSG